MPHRRQLRRQACDTPQLDVRGFIRSVKVTAARGFEAELECKLREAPHIVSRVIAGDDLKRSAAGGAELLQQRS